MMKVWQLSSIVLGHDLLISVAQRKPSWQYLAKIYDPETYTEIIKNQKQGRVLLDALLPEDYIIAVLKDSGRVGYVHRFKDGRYRIGSSKMQETDDVISAVDIYLQCGDRLEEVYEYGSYEYGSIDIY
jgi:hypothetical protein